MDARVQFYTTKAISDNTRRSYRAPVEKYRAWCPSRQYGSAPLQVTPMIAAEFFAHMADQGDLLFNTIRTYRSALGTWWLESTIGQRAPADNPFQHAAVGRVLDGIKRTKTPAQVAARQAKLLAAPEVAFTPAVMADILPHMQTETAQGYMRWAALLTGVYGELRPSELLGSADHPDRYLKATQIAFYRDVALREPLGLPARTSLTPGISETGVPKAYTIALGITKADPHAMNPPHPVTHAAAAQVMWRWMQMRRAFCPSAEEDALFQVPTGQRLTQKELLQALSQAYEAATGVSHRFVGRAFRRSGNSNLLAAGASVAALKKAGRWRTDKMVTVYANAEAKAARAALAAANRS